MSGFAYGSDIGVSSYKQLEAFGKRSGIGFSVSSGYRPGSNDYHGTGNADDLVSSAGSMIALASWFEQYAPYMLELIHAGGKGYFVKNGKVVSASYYGASTVSQHYNHVHVAMTLSGIAAAVGSGGGVVLTKDSSAGSTQGCAVTAAQGVGQGALVLLGMMQVYDSVSHMGLHLMGWLL